MSRLRVRGLRTADRAASTSTATAPRTWRSAIPEFAETDTNPIDNSTLNGMVGVLMGGGPLDAARLAELFPGVDLSWSLGIPLPGLKVYGDGLWNVSLTPGERFGQTIAWGNFDDDDADELLVGSVGTKIRVLNHDGKGDDVIDSSVIPGLAKYPSFVVGDSTATPTTTWPLR